MIKQLEDFAIKTPSWLLLGFVIFMTAMAAGALIGYFAPSVHNAVPLAFLITGAGALFICFDKTNAVEIAKAERYQEYLTSLDIDLLKRAQSSPEMSAPSKEQITTHLNEKHPGWSLQ